MTRNATGGPATPAGKPFIRVDRGWYRLEETSLPQSRTPGPFDIAPTHRPGPTGSALADRLDELTGGFDHFVEAYDRLAPFQRSGQYALHRATIDRRRDHPDVLSAIADDELLRLLHETLAAWGIGRRASVLAPLETFMSRIRSQAWALRELDGISCEDADTAQAATPAVWELITDLKVVENRAKVVAGTKTLHHLLPDLVPPMDRAWTGRFFNWAATDPQYRQEHIFTTAFEALVGVATKVLPSRLLGKGWRTSASKLLDNALIGYCLEQRAVARARLLPRRDHHALVAAPSAYQLPAPGDDVVTGPDRSPDAKEGDRGEEVTVRATENPITVDPRVVEQARERALRYLDFLEAYHLRRFPPVHDIGDYNDAQITDRDLPEAPGIEFSEGGDVWLTVDLIDLPPTPPAPADLEDWLIGAVLATSEPEVRHPDERARALLALFEEPPTGRSEDLDELDAATLEALGIVGVGPGEVVAAAEAAKAELDAAVERLEAWTVGTWRPWSERWLAIEVGRSFYKQLFDLRTRLEREREVYELVWGFGRTRWTPTADGTVVRVDHPMMTASTETSVDRRSGRLTVAPAGPLLVEGTWTVGLPLFDRRGYADQRASAEEIETDPWGPGRRELVRSLLRAVDQDGRLLQPGERHGFGEHAVADSEGWVLFVRRRRPSFQGFLDTQRKLYAEGAPVPAPFAALVIDEPSALDQDGDSAPWGRPEPGDTTTGSSEDAEADLLPLPTNEEQLEIVSLARTRAGVTAQGPPGTGKSHTIANLISHYVAHGRRVLVTAQKEQALEVLIEKVPEAIRGLCVPVLGSDAAGRARLQLTVAEIAAGAQRRPDRIGIARLESELDAIEARYAETTNLLRTKRAAEVGAAPHRPSTRPDDEWTPSAAAAWVREHEALAGIPDELDRRGDPPLSTDEFIRLEVLARELEPADALAALRALPEASSLLTGGQLAVRRTEAASLHLSLAQVEDRVRSWEAVDQSDEETLLSLAGELEAWAAWQRRAAANWVGSVLADAKDPSLAASWQDFCESATREREAILAINRTLAAHRVTIDGIDGRPVPSAEFILALTEARTRFAAGKSIGPFQRSLRRALDACSTNGHTPASVEDIDLVMAEAGRREQRQRLENRWANIASRIGAPPLADERPVEDLLGERITAAREALAWSSSTWPELAKRCRSVGLGDLSDPDEAGLLALTDACRVLRARLRVLEIETETDAIRRRLVEGRAGAQASALWGRLVDALDAQADNTWDELRAEAERLASLRPGATLRHDLLERLSRSAPLLADLMHRRDVPIDPQRFEASWRWRQLDLWLHDLDEGPQPAELQARLERLAVDKRRVTTDLVAKKAWAALSESIDDRRRSALNRYTVANARLGKGTGRYAPTWAAEARAAMVDAQDAVPVWIMPLHKVLTSFRPAAEPPFDVVIVDEASQVGLLETPVLALGRRAIIVGDDQQTSPENVGLERQSVLDLIDDFLLAITDRKTRFNPENSLYDLARQQFPQVVQLREHFRCLPRIIEFSSAHWYGGSIVPLRDQPPRPGWQPVGTVFVPSGVRRNSDDTNHAEAEAVADLIAELTSRSDYDEMTFGVVTLQGSGQGPLINSMLLDRFGPRFVEERNIRVGEPASFQGDERDVIILSTVVAHDSDRRIGPTTTAAAGRRINVAASRAKNQLWMVHSVDAEAFHRDDPRRWLLEYCSTPLDEAAQQAAIDATESGFERDVLTRILARGYTRVTAQYAVGGFRIDLVVEGPENRLAVECDGDYWHGPEAWDRDRARQTVLERAGWTFERIRGSAFYRDPDAALEPLWQRLEQLGIPTGDWANELRPGPAGRVWPDDFPNRLPLWELNSDVPHEVAD